MLGIVTKARVKITPAPEQVSVILAAFPDIEAASQAVTAIISAGIVPAALEMMDALTIQAVEPAFHAGYPMDAGAVLLIEIDGRPEDVQETQTEIESICRQAQAMQVRSATSKVERDLLWKGRKMAIAAMGRLAPNYYLHDTVVPRTRLPETMKRVYEIADDFSLPIANMFHAGDGNLHPLMLFDRHNKSEVERVLEASKHLITYCVEIGGALTGEHGIGTEKRGYMRWSSTRRTSPRWPESSRPSILRPCSIRKRSFRAATSAARCGRCERRRLPRSTGSTRCEHA